MNRIDAIQSMLAKTPDDVFLHYSLGMEYASQGLHGQAVDEFLRCVQLDGEYIAAYVEGGKSFRSASRLEEARAMFHAGLELARKKGDQHMQDFIRQQLEGLGAGR